MEDKKEQRKIFMQQRKMFSIEQREVFDDLIYEQVISSKEYIECSEILIYISVSFEVDTRKIIENALANGKTVFAPVVTNEKRVMKFYKLTSLDDLIKTKFGVLEPKPIEQWNNNKDALCIVPALVFDKKGYRVGYGGGYYDYFLSANEVKSIGIIYDDFLIEKVLIDCYDQRVDKIITNCKCI